MIDYILSSQQCKSIDLNIEKTGIKLSSLMEYVPCGTKSKYNYIIEESVETPNHISILPSSATHPKIVLVSSLHSISFI